MPGPVRRDRRRRDRGGRCRTIRCFIDLPAPIRADAARGDFSATRRIAAERRPRRVSRGSTGSSPSEIFTRPRSGSLGPLQHREPDRTRDEASSPRPSSIWAQPRVSDDRHGSLIVARLRRDRHRRTDARMDAVGDDRRAGWYLGVWVTMRRHDVARRRYVVFDCARRMRRGRTCRRRSSSSRICSCKAYGSCMASTGCRGDRGPRMDRRPVRPALCRGRRCTG